MERRDLIIELFFTQYPTEFHLAPTLKKGRIKNGKVKREKKTLRRMGRGRVRGYDEATAGYEWTTLQRDGADTKETGVTLDLTQAVVAKVKTFPFTFPDLFITLTMKPSRFRHSVTPTTDQPAAPQHTRVNLCVKTLWKHHNKPAEDKVERFWLTFVLHVCRMLKIRCK